MTMITKTSDQLDDAAEMVLRGINVMFLVALFVAITCVEAIILCRLRKLVCGARDVRRLASACGPPSLARRRVPLHPSACRRSAPLVE